MQIASPTNSSNVLLLNYAGFQVPLQMTSLSIGTNSSVVALSSMLEVNIDTNGNGGIQLGGTVDQGEFAEVKVQGSLQVWHPIQYASDVVPPAAYYLTNGTLTVNNGEGIGGMRGPGQFVQYGGNHNVGGHSTIYGGGGSIEFDTEAEFDIYDGQLTATNGIVAGAGDYADGAYFYQYGGTVNADMSVGGNYYLYGGMLRGSHFTMALNERSDAHVTQTGGTNSAASMELGHASEFGGGAYYTLSNGVIHVDTSVTFGGGQFTQINGQYTIVSNLVMSGAAIEVGVAPADYYLDGGTLSVGGLTTTLSSTFHQNGGTNYVAGDIVLVAAPPPQNGFLQTDQYDLAGGFLSARNEIVNAAVYGGFRQTGGSNQITEKLTVQGAAPDAFYYTLEGGTLTVKDIYVGAGAFFQHTSGNIVQSGLLTLDQGEWNAAAGTQSLGPLQLTGGPSTNSSISFTNGSSILRLANSSAQPWDSTAILYITNWHGSVSGDGETQLFFGSDASGLTLQQLALIKFSLAGGLYPARLLPTGELVPQMGLLTSSISGGTLTLTWGASWTLQSSSNAAGPYEDVQGANNSFTTSMTNPGQFFRLRQ
ncbi:MAG TPA: hypothetical protein VG146_05900 [Verrucomicrobiae bacterium]|nr:hypothetical protein [Verrucomicrobiae bacterium]